MARGRIEAAAPALLLGALAGLLPGAALAHGGPFSYSMTPFFEEGRFIGGAASFGLVLVEDGVPLWAAEEAMGRREVARWYRRLPGDRILAAGFRGMMTTEDRGCSWQPIPGPLEEHGVAGAWPDPDDPEHLFAATTTGGAPNGVFESVDGGRSWTATGLVMDAVWFKRVLVAPGAGDLWAQGGAIAGLAEAVVLRSTDGGAEWSPATADFSGYEDVRLLDRGADGEAIFFAARRVGGGERVLSADGEVSAFEDVGGVGRGTLTDLAEIGDSRFVTTCVEAPSAPGLCRESELHRSVSGGPFRLVSRGPTRCLDASGSPGTLWGCGWLQHQVLFFSTTDGESWQEHIPIESICPRTCPEGSPGAVENEAVWPSLLEVGIGVACGADEGADAGAAPAAGDSASGDERGAPGSAGAGEVPADGRGEAGGDEPAGGSAEADPAPFDVDRDAGCACRLRGPGPARGGAALVAALALLARRACRRRHRPEAPRVQPSVNAPALHTHAGGSCFEDAHGPPRDE